MACQSVCTDYLNLAKVPWSMGCNNEVVLLVVNLAFMLSVHTFRVHCISSIIKDEQGIVLAIILYTILFDH